MSLQSLLQRSFDLSNFIFQFNDKPITQVSYSKQKSTCLQISIQRVNDDVRRYIYLLSRSFDWSDKGHLRQSFVRWIFKAGPYEE